MSISQSLNTDKNFPKSRLQFKNPLKIKLTKCVDFHVNLMRLQFCDQFAHTYILDVKFVSYS